LSVLDLGSNVIKDEGCIKLANAIKGNHASSLLWLSLARNGITVEGVKVLALTIRMRPCHLTHLDLSHNLVGLEGTEALSAALKVNLSVQSLRLASCHIGVNGAGLLAEALKTGCALTTLDLEDNQILGQGSAALANALSGSLLRTPITNLGLRANNIEDGGAVVLAEALKVNCSLVILDLADNAISVTGVSALAEALKGAGYNPTHARRNKHDDVMLFARRQQDLIDFYMRKDSSKVCACLRVYWLVCSLRAACACPSYAIARLACCCMQFFHKHPSYVCLDLPTLELQIPEAKTLLTDYAFIDLVKSLHTKYNELPEGWQNSEEWTDAEARRLSFAVNRFKAEAAAETAELEGTNVDDDHICPPGRPPPAKLQAQLAAFYAKHDISKIPDVEKLLSDYPFEQVVKSLQQKYNALPDGWEEYAETKTKWSLDMGMNMSNLSLSPTTFTVPGFSY
jgi:hypothetical protein